MAPYQKLSSRLLDLASARQSGPTKILQAKPIGYDIDHGALTDKIIARFPNILKALAE
jgi:hypothetical protein